MATGIRDKVAILGMGCSRFGERWNMGAEELLVEAFQECLADAGIEKDQIQAAWLGHCIEEIGNWGVFLPQLYTLFKVVKNPSYNPFADLSVDGKGREARYRYIA